MASKKSSTSGARTAPKSSKASTNGPSGAGTPTSSGEKATEPALLEHIGRYRLSIRPVIAKLFFHGDKDRAADTLRDLTDAGKVLTHRKHFGKYSCYQLTAAGCAQAGVSIERAKPPTAGTLPKHLGVLWFATMKGARRARLRDDILPAGCPTPPGKAPHVAEIVAPGNGCIYRVHVVREKKTHHSVFEQIQATVESFAAVPHGAEFMSSGAYRFAVLVNEDAKKARVEEALPDLLKKLPHEIHVVVETAPSPTNISLFLS